MRREFFKSEKYGDRAMCANDFDELTLVHAIKGDGDAVRALEIAIKNVENQIQHAAICGRRFKN